MTEKQFQAAVIELAKLRGWRVHHAYYSQRSEPGYPDLTLARRGRKIFAELKTEKGRLTNAQKGWLNDLGSGAFLWRPSQLQEIADLLE